MKLSNYLHKVVICGKILTVAGFIESKTHVLLVRLNKQEEERAEYRGREREIPETLLQRMHCDSVVFAPEKCSLHNILYIISKAAELICSCYKVFN